MRRSTRNVGGDAARGHRLSKNFARMDDGNKMLARLLLQGGAVMYEWIAVVSAGLIGGLANSYLATGVLQLPTRIEDRRGNLVLDPGALGYIGIGGIAAF